MAFDKVVCSPLESIHAPLQLPHVLVCFIVLNESPRQHGGAVCHGEVELYVIAAVKISSAKQTSILLNDYDLNSDFTITLQ